MRIFMMQISTKQREKNREIPLEYECMRFVDSAFPEENEFFSL